MAPRLASRLVPSAVLALSLPLGALCQSVSSCGGQGDHLKNVVLKITPDPPEKGSPLLIEASGTLDEDLTALSANVDLHVKALGIITSSVKGALPATLSPGLAKGPASLTLGPFELPKHGHGSTEVAGQVHVVDGKNEPVMCVQLDLNLPGQTGEVEADAKASRPLPVQSVASCGQAGDHIPDFKIGTAGGVTTMTGTLDEAVDKASIDLDLSVKVLFISIPLKVKIPLAFSPSAAKGAFNATVGPSSITVSHDVKAKVKGSMKIDDDKGEELTCVSVDTVVAEGEGFII